MGHKPDKLSVADEQWHLAVMREAIIRPLAEVEQFSAVDVETACKMLGIGRSRLYTLLERYRDTPVTSSLVSAAPGPKKGSRRLTAEMEALIDDAIREKYLTRQKASVSKLHDQIRHLGRARGLAIPSWKAVRARVGQIDRYKLVGRREGSKAAARCSPPASTTTSKATDRRALQRDRRLSPKPAMAKALAYGRKRLDALTRYTGEGMAEIDNIIAERAIRSIAIGRKNWRFAGSKAGGERAAAIYSVIERAKLNGVEPQAYIADVILKSER